MITVSCKNEKITYNAYHLVKAFCPEEGAKTVINAEQDAVISVSGCEWESIVPMPELAAEISATEVMPSEKMQADGVQELNRQLTADGIPELYRKLSEAFGRELPWGMLTGVRPVKLATKWINENLQKYSGENRETTGTEKRETTEKEKRDIAGDENRDAKEPVPAIDGAREDFAAWFYADRAVSRSKAELAFDIALREKEILEKADCSEGTFSLYAGIPFCPSICSYCSFSSGKLADYAGKVDLYVDALIKELGQAAEENRGKRLTSIYVGGGTPTTLSEEQLERLLGATEQLFLAENRKESQNTAADGGNQNIAADRENQNAAADGGIQNGTAHGENGTGKAKAPVMEFTVEAGRPDTITEGKLLAMKRHGVTRVSINPQTMQQKTLDLVGRRHSTEDVRKAFRLARNLGFDNINMDLIVGLPGENAEDVADTLRQIKELAPDSLTVHSLALKRASRAGIEKRTGGEKQTESGKTTGGEKQTESGKTTGGEKQAQPSAEPYSADLAELSRMWELAAAAAAEMGMKPYYLYRQKSIAGNLENTGYALPGREGLYNMIEMEEVESIRGCGAGAVSKTVFSKPVENPERGGTKMTNILRRENVKNIDEYILRNR